jgi:uncharacterized protein
MLLQITIGNFKSFQEPATLSMVAAKDRASKDPKRIDQENVARGQNGFDVLKTAVIYGANASGKSNFIAGIGFMRDMVLGSTEAKNPLTNTPARHFRLREGFEQQPSHFEVVFLSQGTRYRYGFEVDAKHVVSEWLYHAPKSRESQLFLREGSSYTISGAFREGRAVKDKTRADTLFLSACAQWNGVISEKIVQWFGDSLDMLPGIPGMLGVDFAKVMEEFPQAKDWMQSFVFKLNLSIIDFDFQSRPRELPIEFLELITEKGQGLLQENNGAKIQRVVTTHEKYSESGEISGREQFLLHRDESIGTQKIFHLALPILFSLQQGRVIIIDELDSSLHPLLVQKIVQLFHENTNVPASQLIFTTHDTTLLDSSIFRRDQVWFTEKDQYQASVLYSLHDYKIENTKKVREDEVYAKNYLIGKYGAIPYINRL